MTQLANNKKANYDYDIKSTLDCGIVLEGREVKSCKLGNISLSGSYITVNSNTVLLVNCHIGPYRFAPNTNYNPLKSRKLLLKKSEIDSLLGKEKGLIIVPLEIYTNSRGLIKVKIGIGRARKKQDKREYVKIRDTKKEIKKITG